MKYKDSVTEFTKSAILVCAHVLGKPIASVDFPGGKGRQSLRVLLKDGQSVIASFRSGSHQAEAEYRILTTLNALRANVPYCLGRYKRWILQQDIGGERLSTTLYEKSPELWLPATLESLLTLQQQANQSKLVDELSPVCKKPSWFESLVLGPQELSELVKITPPVLDQSAITAALNASETGVIKWDSRPGNAMVDEKGQIIWFDWEHAGIRCPVDDLVSIFGAEYLAIDQALEQRLLDSYLPRFVARMSLEAAQQYFYLSAIFYIVKRLYLVVDSYKAKPTWHDAEKFLQNDSIGPCLSFVDSLCERGERWSAQVPLVQTMGPWFTVMKKTIKSL